MADCFATAAGIRHEIDDSNIWTRRGIPAGDARLRLFVAQLGQEFEVTLGEGVVRVDHEGVAEVDFGLCEFALVGEQGAEIVMGKTVLRIQLQGLLKVEGRLVDFAATGVITRPREVTVDDLAAQFGGTV